MSASAVPLGTLGQLSQLLGPTGWSLSAPTPSPSQSAWLGLGFIGQLSKGLGAPSPSASGVGHPDVTKVSGHWHSGTVVFANGAGGSSVAVGGVTNCGSVKLNKSSIGSAAASR